MQPEIANSQSTQQRKYYMKISKIEGTYADYKLEMSFGQLQAIRDALAADHASPVSDELYGEICWYLDNIPGVGESKADLKKAEEASDSGLASPEAASNPNSPELADQRLPAPDEGGSEEHDELEAEESTGEEHHHGPPHHGGEPHDDEPPKHPGARRVASHADLDRELPAPE